MNIGLIIGLLLGFGALSGGFAMEGGDFASIIGIPAAVIVFGGSFGATVLSNRFSTVMAIPKAISKLISDKKADLTRIVADFVGLADKARREGLLSLEEQAQELEDPFMRKGVMMLVGGTDPEVIEAVLESDTHAMKKRHESVYDFFEQWGAYAPTIGILGAVLGLINVMSNLDSPEELGHGIAVAFVATLYGVGSANLLYLPFAAYLKSQSRLEVETREMMVEGILSIQSGDNPSIVRDRLEAFMPEKQRGKDLEQEPPAAEGEDQNAEQAA